MFIVHIFDINVTKLIKMWLCDWVKIGLDTFWFNIQHSGPGPGGNWLIQRSLTSLKLYFCFYEY